MLLNRLQRLVPVVEMRACLIVKQYCKSTCNCCAACFVAVMVFGAVAGCQFKGQAVPPMSQAPDSPEAISNAWQPIPQRIRIYPSSRFILTESRPALEARVELQDEMGDSVKAPGVFHLELLQDARRGHDAMLDKLYSWDVPLVSIDDQKTYFESVTRTYRFILRLDRQISADDQLALTITFTRADGKLLQTQAVLGPDGVRIGQ
jgi:hypothetical protein